MMGVQTQPGVRPKIAERQTRRFYQLRQCRSPAFWNRVCKHLCRQSADFTHKLPPLHLGTVATGPVLACFQPHEAVFVFQLRSHVLKTSPFKDHL